MKMKIEIKLGSTLSAGWYELVVKDNDISEDVILKISKGQPYIHAKLEAERLATTLNCDLYENGNLVRKSIQREEK